MLQIKMKYPGILLLVLFSLSLTAQQPGQIALQDLYQDVLHPSDAILNGREYKYYFNQRHSPLIPKDYSASTTVLIRKKLYQNVALKYDLYKDLLIYFYPENSYNSMITPVIVNNNIIEEFTLQLASGQARFRYLTFPEDQKGLLNNGFYEIVSEGDCMFIIDHSAIKKIQDFEQVYHYLTKRYIISFGNVHRIKGKKSLLRAFSDRAAEVSKYLKRSKIQVRSADKEQINGVLEYYISL